MIQLLKEELGSALTPKAAPIIKELSSTITTNVPDKMKYTIAVTALMTFASQFRKNALLPDGTLVPSNFISFIIANSGEGKDSSYKIALKPFKSSYDKIDSVIEKELVSDAISKAENAGEDPADIEAVYTPYMKPLVPRRTIFTTSPGLIEMANRVMDLPLGAPLVTTSEISDEYSSNKDTEELIKTIATVYDLGDSDAKVTKGAEFRSQELSGVPISSLMIGSYIGLLQNEAIRNKFITSFSSKLARRSFFVFSKERPKEPEFESTAELLSYLDNIDNTAIDARNVLEAKLLDLTDYGISTSNTSITVSKEVDNLFKLYKRYNTDLAELSPNPSSLNNLVRLHGQWRALKLATTFAFLDKSDVVTATHYTQAMQFIELLAVDMQEFESEINKADHERFSDYIRTLVTSDGKASISLHDLKKKGFIKTTSQSKLHELVQLASGYDTTGIYNVSTDGGAIEYEPIIKADTIGISYKPIDCTALNSAVANGDPDSIRAAKHDISVTTAYGFELADTSFDQLTQLLSGDFAYSPFKFAQGIRGKDNIQGGASWAVLDIDDSPISASEAHFMLSDINHHIALSSDPSNDHKYRVLLELDTMVELSPLAWKYFYLSIANDLALKVDPLPQSQIFFSYANRPILSNLDASPIVTRQYIIDAREKESEKSVQSKTLSGPQMQAKLSDPETTFGFAYNCPPGTGSRNLYRAVQYAKDLGAPLDSAIQLIHDINEYWSMDKGAMASDRIDKLIEQATRLYES